MHYHIPNLRLAEELPPQSAPQDKFGGLPWGLSPSQWPTCRECGKSQSLLAQFLHHPGRLDLVREGRLLNIFQCNHDPGMCSTWEGGSGANACFVLEPEDLVPALSDLPSDHPVVEREVFVTEWLTQDDGVSPEKALVYLTDEGAPYRPGAENVKITSGSRLGGVPFWVQNASEAPQGDWRFVGQLGDTHTFLHPPKITPPGVIKCGEGWEGASHYCDGPNLGGGTGYIFLRNTNSTPEGWFFWQCG